MKAPVLLISLAFAIANTILLCYLDDSMPTIADVFTPQNILNAVLYLISLFIAFIGLYYFCRKITRIIS
jgi:hypothetical protein